MSATATGYIREKLDELDKAKKDERAARARVAELAALVKQLVSSNEIPEGEDLDRAKRLTRPPRSSGGAHGAPKRKPGAHG
jgi:hypothetical protein